MSPEFWMWIFAGVLVLAGLVGTVFPVLPGVPLVFGGLYLAAWAGDFQQVSWITLVVLGLLTALSVLIDLVAAILGTRRVGATRLAIFGAFAGMIVGIFFGIAGIILGPFVGAVIGEFLSHGGVAQASRVGVATWAGLIFGTLAKIGLAVAMVGIFATAYIL